MEVVKNLFNQIIETLSQPKIQAILIWIIAAVLADSFLRNGIRKFDPEGFWSHAFIETWGYDYILCIS